MGSDRCRSDLPDGALKGRKVDLERERYHGAHQCRTGRIENERNRYDRPGEIDIRRDDARYDEIPPRTPTVAPVSYLLPRAHSLRFLVNRDMCAVAAGVRDDPRVPTTWRFRALIGTHEKAAANRELLIAVYGFCTEQTARAASMAYGPTRMTRRLRFRENVACSKFMVSAIARGGARAMRVFVLFL